MNKNKYTAEELRDLLSEFSNFPQSIHETRETTIERFIRYKVNDDHDLRTPAIVHDTELTQSN
jgi:hypothetical protein